MSSFAFDKIVPFWQDFILDDMPFTLALKERVSLFLCLIDASVDRCEDGQSFLSPCSGSHFACLLDCVEHGAAPGSGNLREEPVLDRVPFGTVRRVMCNSDVYADSLGQLYEAPFPLPAPCIIGTSAIAEDEDGLCTWVYVSDALFPLLHEAVACKLRSVVAHSKSHVAGISRNIIDAVRHHFAIGECRIVVVINLHAPGGVGCAVVPPVWTKQFFLFGVNAEYGNAVLLALLAQLLYILELLVALRAVSHRHGLYWLAACVSLSLDDLPDGVEAYVYMIILCEFALYVCGIHPEPLFVGILRKPCDVIFHYLTEYGEILGMHGERGLSSASRFADPALIEVFFGPELSGSFINGVAGDPECTAHKAYSMYSIPGCHTGSELPRLSLVCAIEELHFLARYYICWIFREQHNCLEFSCNVTKFPADLRI